MGKTFALKNDKKTEEDQSMAKLKVKKREAEGMPSPIVKKKAKKVMVVKRRIFLDDDDDDEEEKLPELIENEAEGMSSPIIKKKQKVSKMAKSIGSYKFLDISDDDDDDEEEKLPELIENEAEGMSSPVIKKKQKVSKMAKSIGSNSKKVINKRQFLDISDDDDEEKLPELIKNEASDNEEEENMEVDGTKSVSENEQLLNDATLLESDNEEEAPKSYKKKEKQDEEAPNDAPKSDEKKEKSTKLKSNIVHDEPETIDKIERIDLTRKKQAQIFDQDVWTIADDVKTGNIDVNKWLETHSARDIYFFGDDEVREKMTKKLGFFDPNNLCYFLPFSISTLMFQHFGSLLRL